MIDGTGNDFGGAERSCRAKHRYGTEAEANGAAADCWAKRRTWLRVYACTECGGWHMTKTRAAPQPGWRPPAKSQRQVAREQRVRQRRRRGRG